VACQGSSGRTMDYDAGGRLFYLESRTRLGTGTIRTERRHFWYDGLGRCAMMMRPALLDPSHRMACAWKHRSLGPTQG